MLWLALAGATADDPIAESMQSVLERRHRLLLRLLPLHRRPAPGRGGATAAHRRRRQSAGRRSGRRRRAGGAVHRFRPSGTEVRGGVPRGRTRRGLTAFGSRGLTSRQYVRDLVARVAPADAWRDPAACWSSAAPQGCRRTCARCRPVRAGLPVSGPIPQWQGQLPGRGGVFAGPAPYIMPRCRHGRRFAPTGEP
jgi:hypothetical protein